MASQLAYYEARARGMSAAELDFAIRDVTETLELWPDREPTEPYVAKLLAEFDAFTVARQRRGSR
jgi:hypothetical protein